MEFFPLIAFSFIFNSILDVKEAKFSHAASYLFALANSLL